MEAVDESWYEVGWGLLAGWDVGFECAVDDLALLGNAGLVLPFSVHGTHIAPPLLGSEACCLAIIRVLLGFVFEGLMAMLVSTEWRFCFEQSYGINIPALNDFASSSSLKPPKPNDLATSPYCCATGFLGVKSVPNASKHMRRFFFDIVIGRLRDFECIVQSIGDERR